MRKDREGIMLIVYKCKCGLEFRGKGIDMKCPQCGNTDTKLNIESDEIFREEIQDTEETLWN